MSKVPLDGLFAMNVLKSKDEKYWSWKWKPSYMLTEVEVQSNPQIRKCKYSERRRLLPGNMRKSSNGADAIKGNTKLQIICTTSFLVSGGPPACGLWKLKYNKMSSFWVQILFALIILQFSFVGHSICRPVAKAINCPNILPT